MFSLPTLHNILLIGFVAFPLGFSIVLGRNILPRSAIAYISMHLHVSNEVNDTTWPFWKQLDAALPPLRDRISAPNLLVLVVLKLYVFAARSLHAGFQFVICRWS
jgi:hypothetical protein